MYLNLPFFTLLGESATYTVLFQYTTCYELMPESAKLVTIDSMLPVSFFANFYCYPAFANPIIRTRQLTNRKLLYPIDPLARSPCFHSFRRLPVFGRSALRYRERVFLLFCCELD